LGAPHPRFPGTVSRRRVNRLCHPDGAIHLYPPRFPAEVKTPSRLFPATDFTHPLVKKGRGGPAPPPDPYRVPPLQGTQRGTPLPVSSTGSRRRLNSYHRPERGSGGGTPTVPTVHDPHPPVFPKGDGCPFGQGRGVSGFPPWTDPPPVFEGRSQKTQMIPSSRSGRPLRSTQSNRTTSGSVRWG